MAPTYCGNLGVLYQTTATPEFNPDPLLCPPIVTNVAIRTSATIVRIDLHLHSAASFDCRVPPLEVGRRCRQLGLSPVVLTDHDTIDGARSLREAGEPVVIGQEILTTEGQLVGLL